MPIFLIEFFLCFSEMDFKNKVVLVTGASSGIGAATAEYFAKLGASLAIVGRNEGNLKETVTKCGKNVHAIVADVTKEADVHRIIKETVDRFGRLDVLVNNAGSIVYGPLESATMESFDLMINTNIRSVFLLTKLAIPHLEKTKGAIVNVSSTLGLKSFPNVISYSVSKAAVNHFTACMALELAPKGIRVNAIVPGVILTNLQRTGGMDENTYQEYLKRSGPGHALGRVGNPEEPAAAIAFLASDLSSFTTGVLLPVDGGKHAMCPR